MFVPSTETRNSTPSRPRVFLKHSEWHRHTLMNISSAAWVTFRRIVLPMPSARKRKLDGFIHYCHLQPCHVRPLNSGTLEVRFPQVRRSEICRCEKSSFEPHEVDMGAGEIGSRKVGCPPVKFVKICVAEICSGHRWPKAIRQGRPCSYTVVTQQFRQHIRCTHRIGWTGGRTRFHRRIAGSSRGYFVRNTTPILVRFLPIQFQFFFEIRLSRLRLARHKLTQLLHDLSIVVRRIREGEVSQCLQTSKPSAWRFVIQKSNTFLEPIDIETSLCCVCPAICCLTLLIRYMGAPQGKGESDAGSAHISRLRQIPNEIVLGANKIDQKRCRDREEHAKKCRFGSQAMLDIVPSIHGCNLTTRRNLCQTGSSS